MSNIIDYVKTKCNNNFIERLFTREDAGVLCRISYLKFEDYLEPMSPEGITIEALNANSGKRDLFRGSFVAKEDSKLLEAMAESKRFKNVRICFFDTRFMPGKDIQFAAMTFMLPGARPFVVFRGTDETMVGWKEDLYLALNKPIGGQKLSAGYLNTVSGKFNGKFNVGGHSKGGNLAVYATMTAREAVKRRISTVFSLDAPGFRSEVLEENGYGKIADKVVSIVPKSSVVGMLFNYNEDSFVVNARSKGVFQHSLYNWIIPISSLEYEEAQITDQHRALLNSINEWIFTLEDEELERVVELVDRAMTVAGMGTLNDLSGKDAFKAVISVIKAAKGVSEETKEFLGKVVKMYVNIAKDMVKKGDPHPSPSVTPVSSPTRSVPNTVHWTVAPLEGEGFKKGEQYE